jgi:subtilisin family serine protease
VNKTKVWNVALLLCVGLGLQACFVGGGRSESTARTGNLALKSPRFPLANSFAAPASPVEPNDPSFGAGLPFSSGNFYDQKWLSEQLNADWAWARNTDCSQVTIAIVDTGVDYAHGDITGNLKNIASSGSPVYGRNEFNASSEVMDDHGHGTHVAGIIGAVGNNNTGITGVCWQAQMIVSKALDSQGKALTSDVVRGLEWSLNQGANIINASFGISIPGTTLQEDEFFEDIFSGVTSKLQNNGSILVAAAGNAASNNNVDRVYPASLKSPYVIAVAANRGALGQDGLWGGSNFGGRMVHLSAPGVDILSTLPRKEATGGGPPVLVDNYGLKTGTSMAAPVVAGSLALMWSYLKQESASITTLNLIDLFLDNVKPHTTSSQGVPGQVLMTGSKLNIGWALEATEEYIQNNP